MILAGVAALFFQAPALGHGQAPGRVMREIIDGATGDRWLLVRDAAHSGGPGRMVRVARGDEDSRRESKNEPAQPGTQSAAHAAPGPVTAPAIRAGDAVMVEEHSPVVDARLEATALGSAEAGAELEARLKMGGKTVRVKALGPGRAELVPEPKAHP
jgi:hypothetical protein